jgi:hypothetical protein
VIAIYINLVLRKRKEALNIFIVQKRPIVLLLITLLQQTDHIAHHYYAMPKHNHRLILLPTNQLVVLSIQIETVSLHILQSVTLHTKGLRTNIVLQLRPILFLVLTTHLFQLLLTQNGVLPFVYYLLSLYLLVYFRQQLYQPFRQPEQLVIVIVLRYLQSQQKLKYQTTVMQDVHTLLKSYGTR